MFIDATLPNHAYQVQLAPVAAAGFRDDARATADAHALVWLTENDGQPQRLVNEPAGFW